MTREETAQVIAAATEKGAPAVLEAALREISDRDVAWTQLIRTIRSIHSTSARNAGRSRYSRESRRRDLDALEGERDRLETELGLR